MTSKNSFWASCRENNKRRIWVWIVAVLSQLLPYGGITMIYLSRIKNYNADGIYKTAVQFQDALYRAAKDALGFSEDIYKIIILLAALIGMQGFSYLYDRRKVDLYHSVPVNKSRRFAAVYINGLFMYLAANLTGILFGLAVAASQGAVNGSVLTDVGLAFLWNLVMFLAFYHTMILAVMLTGNWFVTVCGFGVITLYEFGVSILIEDLHEVFFRTYSGYFLTYGCKLSVFMDVINNMWQLKNLPDTAAKADLALPIVGRWVLIAAALLLLAYAAYRKRPSEAAGKAIAFPILEPVLKVAVVIPAALLVGVLVYETSYRNEVLQILAMAAAGVIFCGVAEVLFDFDMRSVFKHLVSSGVALAGILAIFCIFKWDLFGYDNYLPAQNKVESIAILTDGYYDNYSYWDENYTYVSNDTFVKENMFLTDTEPVLALAQAYLQTDEAAVEEMTAPRTMRILYRLRSGREVVRAIVVDYEDPETWALLNRIFQTQEFKKGTFQVLTDETSYDRVTTLSYTNGAVNVAVPKEEIRRLREAWIKDMEQFDFTMARDELPCGRLNVEYDNYAQKQWYVYDGFENTIALLNELEAYYPAQLDAKDIDSVTVICYHNELKEEGAGTLIYRNVPAATAETVSSTNKDYTVRETFDEEEQIAQILPHIHADYLNALWGNYKGMDPNYVVEIVFKKDTTYPYQRDSYYFRYNFIDGQVPDFVAEATAYTE